MSKTHYKPNTVSYGSYSQMFLDDSNKHFIDAERALPYNEVLSWGGRKHSEGMMPFMNDEDAGGYPTMDYLWPSNFLPPPDGVGHPDWPLDAGGRGGDNDPTAWRFNCIISCESPIQECNNKFPIRCWYNAVTGNGSATGWELLEGPDPTPTVTFQGGGESGYVYMHLIWWETWQQWWGHVTELSGSSFAHLNVQYTDVGTAGDELYYHPLLDQWITIKGGSSTCTTDITFFCCDDIPELEFDDDATSDTISAGGSIQLNLVDGTGYGPFSWTVDGEGYTLDAAETEDRSNTLNADANVCDTPVGDGETNAVAWITVTDMCGYSVSFGIRHEDGDWHYCYGASRSACDPPVGGFTYTYSYQDALGKYDPGVYRLGAMCSTTCSWTTHYNNLLACGNPVDWFSWFASTYGCVALNEVKVWDWRC